MMGFFLSERPNHQPPKRLPPDISRMDRISDRASALVASLGSPSEKHIEKCVICIYVYVFIYMYMYLYIYT